MIHDGEILNGTYQVIRQIGRGGTGLVFLAYHRNLRKYVVVKRVQTGLANIESLRAETDILKNLHNSHIPQVYDFLVRDGEVFTVMDYIEGTSFDQLKAGNRRLSEAFLVNLLFQMGQTLSYLHRNRPPVIHSDIKPDNLILKSDGEICLIDFNISVSAAAPSGLSGYSLHFASPEQWRRSMELRTGRRSSLKLDTRTDIFSTGALFYYLITGKYPDTRLPAGDKTTEPYRKSGSSGYPTSGSADGTGLNAAILYRDMVSCGYSEPFCGVVAKCLEPDRRHRYADGSKLYAAVRHLRRQDRRFRNYLLLRAGSWILTAMLVGSGSWFLIRGGQQRVVDAYTQAMSAFTWEWNQQNIQEASEKGESILNDSRFDSILKEKPQDAALILQAMGDASYAIGQYGDAQSHYEKALDQAKEWADKEQVSISRYYRDYAIALVMDGQLRRAQIILDEAKREGAGGTYGISGISDPDSALVEAYIAQQNGDEEACRDAVTRILNMNADGELKARACTVAAGMSGDSNDEDQEIDWLLKAAEYSGDSKYQRLLGAAYWKRADDSRRTKDQKEKDALLALQCYERLASRPLPLMDDLISRVVVMQYLGQYQDSLRILEPLLAEYPQEYRIPMYMAFACESLSDRYRREQYAKMALDLYENLPAEKKQGTEGDEIRHLREIR